MDGHVTPAEEHEAAKQVFRDKPKDPDGRMGGCTSYLQRKLQCGYNHAANIMLRLEHQKFISEVDGDGKRRLLAQ